MNNDYDIDIHIINRYHNGDYHRSYKSHDNQIISSSSYNYYYLTILFQY